MRPKEILRAHILQKLGQCPPNLELVLDQFEEGSYKRGTVLLQQGQVCKHVYFITKGCFQVYTTDAEGLETTRDIVLEDNWVSELISFGSGQPATESIRAVENTEACTIGPERFQQMLKQVPQFESFYRQILEASYFNSVYRINSFVALNALQRVQWLLAYRPGLLSRLPSKLMASYLGISQETFSRLRSKL